MKKLFKILLAAVLLSSFGFSAFAEEEFESGSKNRNAIGVYGIGAETSLYGIQYERRFTDFISGKVGTYVFYNNNEYSTYPFQYQLTTEVDFTLYEEDWFKNCSSRLFAYTLIGSVGDIFRDSNYNSERGETTYEPPVFRPDFVASVGFGFDFIFFKHLSVPFQFGFIGSLPNTKSIGFCGGTGLRYSW